MRLVLLIAALAVTTTAALAQTPNWQTMPVTAGSWGYRAVEGGSEAVFTDARATRRMMVKCSRATRLVSVSVTSAVPGTTLQVSTTDLERSLPAVFYPQAFQIAAQLSAHDPLLDAIVFSRGRFVVTVRGGASLVLPPWPEIARSIEDCRN